MNKIVICDDDQFILEMLQLVLEDLNYEVIIEKDSSMLIELLFNNKPDLLIVDLWMHNLDGDTLVRRIRSDVRVSSTPILMMSASRDGEAISKEAGADRYLAKPFELEELLKEIAVLVNGGKEVR